MHLNQYNKFICPSVNFTSELQCDVRGCTEVHGDKMQITLGEVKSGKQFNDTVKEAAYRWASQLHFVACSLTSRPGRHDLHSSSGMVEGAAQYRNPSRSSQE
mmetsp:Transcript_26067/g.35831  ORF Transcript_26067/g.35831 Transcript_26067/m.35831 type:complete len:102 (-) Transcript_26067:45-350(-)